MKEWLTAREIAAEQLPELPTAERALIRFAERHEWTADADRCRKRQGRGGGIEYHVSLLPQPARVEYRARYLRVGSPTLPPAANDEAESRRSPPTLTSRAALERDARLLIVQAYVDFKRGQRLTAAAAAHLFSTRYRDMRLLADKDSLWVRDIVRTISPRSLARWADAARQERDRLAFDRADGRKGTGVLETADGGKVRLTILALLADNAHFSAKHLRDAVEKEYGETLAMPDG